MLFIYKITLFLLSLGYCSMSGLSQAMEDTSLTPAHTPFYEQEAYEKGIFTAQQDASFTFQVHHKDFVPFIIHFTNHSLPISALSESTYRQLQDAQTIVLEPIPWDDEPKALHPRIEEVFKKHLVDPSSHQSLKSELSEQDYEKLTTYFWKAAPKFFTEGYFAKFEELNSLAFCFFLRKLQKSEEAKNGMDSQIEQLAIEKGKTLTGLESFFEKFITEMPLALQVLQQTRGPFLTQDITWYLHNLSSETPTHPEESLSNPWNSHYAAGKFFLLCYLSDQENANDIDNVKVRDSKWIPRIKEILGTPNRYPSPLAINVGYGHHGLLSLLEEEKFEILILNKKGEAYPFRYTQSYETFRQEYLFKKL